MRSFKFGRGFIRDEVNFHILSVQVQVEERRIGAQWTPEMLQHFEARHNIDAEAELTRLLSEELVRIISIGHIKSKFKFGR